MKKAIKMALVGAAVIFATMTAQASEWEIVHAGRLLAVPGASVSTEQSIVIKDGRIERIAPGYLGSEAVGAGPNETVTIHDLKDMFVLPGLIDMHTHLSFVINPNLKLEQVEDSISYRAFVAADYGRDTLMAGFTTVRNVGGGEEMLAYRDAVRDGLVDGPRVFAVGGGISGTGGHADTHGYREDILKVLENPYTCDGVGDCRRAVRALVRHGADLIKITSTGGVLSETGAGLNQQMFDDELRAVVETARTLNRRVAAHAHGADGINAALRAGVDSIEHGTFLDEESIRLFQRSGAYLVPTLMAPASLEPVISNPDSFLPPPQREKARVALKRAREYVREAHNGGVKIAFGTDAGVFPHGLNGQEFALLIEWGGMTPMEAIVSATVNAADLLGESENLGTLEPGKYGDLIAVDGDPLVDVTELEDVDFVMKEGATYKAP